jgi:cellulose synthase/poly-beta-1,6-N-acetylglucosamine synthase-like glycosyltransferase
VVSLVTDNDNFRIDLKATPPDDTLLADEDLNKLLTAEVVPWRRFGQRMVYVTGKAEIHAPELPEGIKYTNFVAADPEHIRQYITKHLTESSLETARALCPEKYSCRNFHISPFSPSVLIGFLFTATTLAAFPDVWLLGLLIWVMLANLATTLLRLTALLSWRKDNALPYWLPEKSTRISAHRQKPKVTLLVPLFKEDAVLPRLINTLEKLDYPRELLEIKFLLEEVDTLTADALSRLTLSEFIQCITVPKDWLQTKPKAMNYALPYCTGDIIGIYDAEDRPDPDQILKVVDHFLAAPANVACLQGYLDYYNSRSNWISRCFTIEYATWFRVILKGIQNIGLPIPLGGTTVFFRRNILEEIGGWDAHNVTEDADLGMRLARFGYRCEMVNTTTWEEANNRPMAWVRQRSRWLKGFAMTWATHMRDPAGLLRDLGVTGFISFQVILLGGLSAFLAAPIFWALWLAHFSIPVIPIDAIPTALWWIFAIIMISGQVVMLTAISLATMHKHLRHLIPYILALPFYWPLGMLASYKAIAELFFAPFYWDKTFHGRNDED